MTGKIAVLAVAGFAAVAFVTPVKLDLDSGKLTLNVASAREKSEGPRGRDPRLSSDNFLSSGADLQRGREASEGPRGHDPRRGHDEAFDCAHQTKC